MINIIEKFYSVTNNSSFCYKMTLSDGKILFVPNDPANTDYQEIQKWIADGNTVIDNGGNN